MKKILILTTALLATSDAFALSGSVCYVNQCTNLQTADSSCDNICNWCKGTATTPDGYVYRPGLTGDFYPTSFSRQVNQECGETTYSCVCNDKYGQLATSAEVVCDTGYYGTPTYTYTERYGDYFAGCYPCPSSGTTAAPGATSITECYIPSGNTFADDSGSGEYSGDCYYTK